ncbi:MAG: tryptophan synthase subunit beta [Nanoarchaeota archaeon]|nr:tryptophan synthase subunit beta [Nanoarchaeota archaeon]
MVCVKVCGITSVEDALACAESGADIIGLNFCPGSPRLISVEQAHEIQRAVAERHPGVRFVGVFQDTPLSSVTDIANRVPLDSIQLHGSESVASMDEIKAKTGKEIIKVVKIKGDESFLNLPQADYLLFDSFNPQLAGGSGTSIPIELLERHASVLKACRIFIAGGLCASNLSAYLSLAPFGVDLNSKLESAPGKKDPEKVRQALRVIKSGTTMNSYYGAYGGMFVSELLVPALKELEEAFSRYKEDPNFINELQTLLHDFAGRPTPLTLCERLGKKFGCKVYLKREDLLHTGAHKINNALGQALLAKYMGKTRIIAETGAGQHGVAAAAAAAKLGLKCDVYMGTVDMARQRPNVLRMRLFGANLIPVDIGSKTLKDAVNEALRDYTANSVSTHYLLGSALGPHPYPSIVAHFQAVIGTEARQQIIEREGRLPSTILACVGGGSNAIGIFQAFLDNKEVKLIGVEAGGLGIATGKHAARFSDPQKGRVGIFHGMKSFVLQNADGQIQETHSISAGLDYPGVGPQHAHLREMGRAHYVSADDKEALEALKMLSTEEGIIPALESAHAIAHLCKVAKPGELILINLSGRGDKDLDQIQEAVRHE